MVALIKNDFISGQDKYPKTLAKGYDLLINYINPSKQGGVDRQELGMSFYQEADSHHEC
jgi:hypothetical protein